MKQFDFLIIGTGIAGLSAALKLSEHGSVCIMTKADEDETNTKYAQGGIAGVFNHSDSFEKHISDTLISGDGLCNKKIVDLVVREGPKRIKELMEWGTGFDKNEKGELDLAKEGGHSDNRILHFQDSTGAQIEKALLKQLHSIKNVTLLEHYFSLEIITQHHFGMVVTKSTPNVECYGVYAFDLYTNTVVAIASKILIIASGGAGQVYRNTTNPLIATGDGIAIAYRAKAKVENMEFYQFHPTALFAPGSSPAFLISEAMRGAGAVLRNHKKEEFMTMYDKRGSLSPRDITAKAMDTELKKSGKDYLFLDCTPIKDLEIRKHFPTIFKKCKSVGFDIRKDFIPVVPAAHYSCGGIKTDEWGRSSIKNLFACGECASTGLHGANRLASNSLLEAIVFADRIATRAIKDVKKIKLKKNIPEWNTSKTTKPPEMILISQARKEVQELMSNYLGIVRTDTRLNRAMKRLSLFYHETEEFYKKTIISLELCELRNIINVSYLIIKSAMLRKESRGLHFNSDHPGKNERAVYSTVF